MNLYASFINLDHRTDRLTHMKLELERVGLKAERTQAIPWRHLVDNLGPEFTTKVTTMLERTPGAIGCHYSQVSVMKRALELGKHALVMEDDLIFCSDFFQRMAIIEQFCDTHQWDVFWLGGCYHLDPQWHREGHPVGEIHGKCECTLNRDWEPTDNERIRRTYGSWSTHCYIVNIESIQKVLDLLEANVHRSIGIDFLFILLSPQLNTFAFNPGLVKQYDNQSDIGKGMTQYSRFKHLGPHWYQDYMND